MRWLRRRAVSEGGRHHWTAILDDPARLDGAVAASPALAPQAAAEDTIVAALLAGRSLFGSSAPLEARVVP